MIRLKERVPNTLNDVFADFNWHSRHLLEQGYTFEKLIDTALSLTAFFRREAAFCLYQLFYSSVDSRLKVTRMGTRLRGQLLQ